MPAKKYPTFGEVLKKIREEKGLNANQVRVMAGISMGTIPKIEKEGRDPGFDLARKICAALGVSLDEVAAQLAPVVLNDPPGPRGKSKKAKKILAKPKDGESGGK